MSDYLGQAAVAKENKVRCNHRYRICDCGAVHCLGECGFWQEGVFSFEERPEKRAPCEFHKPV